MGHILAATPTLAPIPGLVPNPTTCIPLSSKADQAGRGGTAHGVYPNDDELRALNSCLTRVRSHVTSPSRSSLVAPPPSLKEAARVRGAVPKARSYPGTACDRLRVPGSLVFQRTGRSGRSVTSGSGSQPFLPPPRRAALATRFDGQLPAVLPLSGGGFRAAVACFRFPTSALALRLYGCESGGCREQRGPG